MLSLRKASEMIQMTIIIDLGDNHTWKTVEGSDRVSYIVQTLKRPGKGGRTEKIKTVYVGFDNWLDAAMFARTCRKTAQARESIRSLDWAYEVKIQADTTLEYLQEFSESLDESYKTLPVEQTLKLRKSAKRKLAIIR